MPELDGKVAIITGAGRLRGIGRATAVHLARLGADLLVTGTTRDPATFPPDEREVGWRDIESTAEQVHAQDQVRSGLLDELELGMFDGVEQAGVQRVDQMGEHHGADLLGSVEHVGDLRIPHGDVVGVELGIDATEGKVDLLGLGILELLEHLPRRLTEKGQDVGRLAAGWWADVPRGDLSEQPLDEQGERHIDPEGAGHLRGRTHQLSVLVRDAALHPLSQAGADGHGRAEGGHRRGPVGVGLAEGVSLTVLVVHDDIHGTRCRAALIEDAHLFARDLEADARVLTDLNAHDRLRLPVLGEGHGDSPIAGHGAGARGDH